MTNLNRVLLLGVSALAVTGCEADEIVSPGTWGDVNVVINNPTPSPAPTPSSANASSPS